MNLALMPAIPILIRTNSNVPAARMTLIFFSRDVVSFYRISARENFVNCGKYVFLTNF